MALVSRRQFLIASAGGVLATTPSGVRSAAPSNPIHPIRGSWFEFQHHNPAEGIYWNPACAAFSGEQWSAKVKEMADLGMEFLVLMCTALHFKAFYDTDILPKFELACPDPIETLLSAADKYKVKFFMGGGFYGKWDDGNIITDPVAAKKRLQAIEELAAKYGRHRSFYGWYWPNEAFINRCFQEEFITYVNTCSRLARSLQPKTKILIAPYGTRVAVPDDTYVRQLERLDVDIVAYQDEVGVRKSKPEELAALYEGLRIAHDRVPQRKLWSDTEVFEFEGETYRSALLPAPFERVEKQLAAVSPYVDVILIYQYQGMMSKPGANAYAGHERAAELYTDYASWLRRNHPTHRANGGS
jgi:hypothetical protein